ncbi:unnamed protein product [Fructobacillus fructosus]|uniref:hypothetical protein n=1 Tax=Fructobacillus fructosus TaxID=1631 RepID=UPI0002195D2F|nr:hypothetical protein [Fructobacillus fructosus]KRN53376.1 hypothetical protein IV71_GL000167 [Fructobacillus fructosus KCTC 3544]GAP00646.1 hypothetical protein FFRU_010480 [Fructobacillus fructosus]CAK1224400.1 unnamed protein product [Fructobacillus fructosus]CAK1227108.1 unnamed protein product [Fructobacillus fructosus]
MNGLKRKKIARNVPALFLVLLALHTMLTTDKPIAAFFAGLGAVMISYGLWRNLSSSFLNKRR